MSDVTLGAFFRWDGGAPDAASLTTIGSTKAVDRGRGALQRKPPERVWLTASRGIARALGEALHVDLEKVLVGGWNSYRTLLEYADPSKHPAGEVAQVALGRHTISSSHKPGIDVVVNGVRVTTLTFAVDLELEIESAILTVQDARIKEVALGRCTGKGRLSCEGAVLVERHTTEINFPGRLSLGEGIPIAG